MKQYNRIADEILTLDTFPERFRIMDSEPEKRMELPGGGHHGGAVGQQGFACHHQ